MDNITITPRSRFRDVTDSALWPRSLLPSSKCKPVRLLAEGQHQQLRTLCLAQLSKRWRNRLDSRQKLALLYLARSDYLQGRYEESQAWLDKLLGVDPYHTDARYLATDLARVQHQYEQAWQQLEALYPFSQRRKTWLYMAQLVRTTDDWQRLHDNYQKAVALKQVPPFHPVVNEYLAVGSQRAGHYEHARSLWRDILLRWDKKPRISLWKKPRTVQFPMDRAAIALRDIQRTLQAADIEMFLVSGTLLGCMRERRLLAHDNDIDIGVWDDVPEQALVNVLGGSGFFHLLPRREKDCLRVKHISGIAIDVFVHHREAHTYWHGGIKVRWHNSPFTLTTAEFLGDQYLVPENHDRYLTENYGDWKIPQQSFDSTLDTPNAEILCSNELTLHCFKKLYKAMSLGNRKAVARYSQYLAEFGEAGVIKRLRIT